MSPPVAAFGQTTDVFDEQVISTVLCGTVRIFQPFGSLPPCPSSTPALPFVSLCSVAVGPAARTHTVFVTVFLFLPVPVVVVVLIGLKRTYWLGVPVFALAWTRESS